MILPFAFVDYCRMMLFEVVRVGDAQRIVTFKSQLVAFYCTAWTRQRTQ